MTSRTLAGLPRKGPDARVGGCYAHQEVST